MVGRAKEKSEITAISHEYKDTFNDFINRSDTKSPDHLNSPNWPGLIDKRLRNALKFKDNLSTFLEEDCLDENILIALLEPAPKI